jgi:hypothetical protein
LLHKETRKALSERIWLQLKERDSNPRLTLMRLKKQSITAIDDISLLARKLPEDTLSGIFSYERLKKLIEAILWDKNSDEYSDINNAGPDPRRTYLGALLAQEGIKLCTKAYLAQNRETPILTEATVDQLNKTIKICNEIAYLVDLPARKESKDDLQYLFNWSRVPGPDESKFVELIESISGPIYENFKDVGISTHETRKKEPPISSYKTAEELRSNVAGQRTSELVLNIIGPYFDAVAGYFSFKLLYGIKAVELEYISCTGKGSRQLDTSDIIVKQDYGNYYIYRKK